MARKAVAKYRRGPGKAKLIHSFPIVGIGASAGGLEAMSQLLKVLPAKTGLAFVLVQHLDPTHASALTALLSRLTGMPVTEARDNMPLRVNEIFVIPPNRLMGLANRRLKLFPRKDSEAQLSIDHSFRTLADEEGNRAIGVLLSGSGSDGTQGLLAIKAAGGLTLAQDERSAKYAAMPGNAITAGCVDFVLTPEKIARELSRIAGHAYVGHNGEEPEAPRPAEEKAFTDILLLLRQRMAVDFTHYKHATLQRRMQRRMVLHKCESLPVYAAYLRSHAGEVKELFGDILIHVTEFFRDAGAFQALKKKWFPRLVKGRAADEAIRIWVPGCSTGEEVYSIAMTLLEFMGDRKLHQPVQIFGTDIHEAALERARAGLYGENIRADVSAERLRRFFVKTEAGYRINKSIRELCIFARQNVVADPPFSNLDLISCRNLLIYLGAPLQHRILPLFHYALKPTGYLMLGASETVGGFGDLFALGDKKAKLYLKKSTSARPSVSFAPTAADLRPTDERYAPTIPVSPSQTEVQRQADRVLLTSYAPAGVIINRQMDVLHFRGHTGAYLEHAHGDASLNLLKMAREGLVVDLRAVVNRAIQRNERVQHAGVRLKQNGHAIRVALEVIPYAVPPASDRYYLVLFKPVTARTEPAPKPSRKALRSTSTTDTVQLQDELEATRKSLQTIIEEQGATNEALRSANEEILSSNEELQSTNEEMETAKEELQSTNEELTTLNDELESRNTELEHTNNDLHNVLGSVNIPIIILDVDLKIRRLTGVAMKMFNLIPGDVGRPLTDINLGLDIPELSKLVLEVIDTLLTKELEVQDRAGHWWSVRIRPYKTVDNKIDGAIVALVDVDVIKTAAETISRGRAFADALINAMRQPALLLDQDFNVQAANGSFYRDFSVNADETLHRRIYALGDGQWDIPKLRTLLEDILPQNSSFEGFEVAHDFPRVGPKRLKLDARRLALKGDKQHLILLTMQGLPEKEVK